MEFIDDGVRMEIADTGIGFDAAMTSVDPAGDSFGFAVMRRRMRDLGGALIVGSSAGQGVQVTATIEDIR